MHFDLAALPTAAATAHKPRVSALVAGPIAAATTLRLASGI